MLHDTALQIRMSHLLKKMFRGLDIARPCLFFESLPSTPINIEEHEYIILTEMGSPKSYVKIGTTESLPLSDDICLDQAVSLQKVLLKLAHNEVIFFKALGKVVSYVTLNDVQKAPVRMWAFGMVTVMEMFITRIVKEKYNDELLSTVLSPGRIEKTKELKIERQRRGQDPDFIDCLQLRDKIEILAKDQELRDEHDFASKTQIRKMGKQLEEFRNDLAHSQTLSNIDLIWLFAEKVDKILTRI